MHPVLVHREYLKQRKPDAVADRADGAESRGLLRRWLGAAIRHWQRRKMIASLEAMNDEVLREIGVDRDDIPRMVEDLSDRELRMAPPENTRIEGRTFHKAA